jgi:hypothetical protein
MVRGTQIARIPSHANNNVTHPDVEFGFITKSGPAYSFCRYWLRGKPGVLRTASRSESTSNTMLVEYKSVPQEIVQATIREINLKELGF